MIDEMEHEERAIADLLPWYATGRLSGPDRQRVGVALAADPALQRELSLILEEKEAAIEVNEALGAPSRQAVDRFFAALDAQAPAKKARFDLAGWLTARLEGLKPQTLAFGGMAVAVLVLAQASVIGVMVSSRPASYSVASVSPGGTAPSGSRLIIAFEPNAPAATIQRLLEETGASIIEGPLPGGLYELRVGDHVLSKPEIDTLVARLKARKGIVRFAAPGTQPE